MDDLTGLNWTPSTQSPKPAPTATGTGNYFPTLRPTPPISGRSTPSLVPQNLSQNRSINSSNPPGTGSTPAPDSFANLLPFNSGGQSTKGLSLQEQQRILQEQRAKQETEKRKQWDTRSHALEGLGSGGRATPNVITSPPGYAATSEYGGQKLSESLNKPFSALGSRAATAAQRKASENENDILAAFDRQAPVDSSTNFPIPTESRSTSTGPPAQFKGSNGYTFPDDDDDPFGLGVMHSSQSNGLKQHDPTPEAEVDDDVLGLLGKPVTELPPPKAPSPDPTPKLSRSPNPADKAIAELVDMGFPVERCKAALESTESGLDVQGAVGWLLNRAHSESRNKSRTPVHGERELASRSTSSRPKPGRTTSVGKDESTPAWMRQSASMPRRDDSRSPANGEKDAATIAAELGNNLFKTAGSLWKTGTKRLNKAVAELSAADGDNSQPKWMREAQASTKEQSAPRTGRQPARDARAGEAPHVTKPKGPELLDMTDEAMMLESGGGRPQARQRKSQAPAESSRPSSTTSSRVQSPFAAQARPELGSASNSRARITRQALEEESAQAYVSPSRRKKAVPKPPSLEPDLLFGDSQQAAHGTQNKPAASPVRRNAPQQAPSGPKASAAVAVRPKAPSRNIPPLSSIALKSSTTQRLAGNAAFKIGNYDAATTAYGASLRDLPPTHPLTLLLLTNRALTNLKTGNPKACIADADAAIALIGPSRGEGEGIETGTEEGTKDMAPLWGKAMMRRAEGLEQLERWTEAAGVWKVCVEGGVGGGQSIQGRNRCEKATAPAARRRPAKKAVARAKPAPRVSALDDLGGGAAGGNGAGDHEAVARLRAANQEADRVDEEKFQLADAVDARLSRWRKGKETNLRALLGSLDTVLWEGSGWRKVGMGELIVPGKVKIAYMKGIGKVHPDKLPTTATTEQVMISGAVFSTLNEAWEKFKNENGL